MKKNTPLLIFTGLAVAAAEMAFAGGVGVEISISSNPLTTLFAESNTRFVVEVKEADAILVKSIFKGQMLQLIGKTTATAVLSVVDSRGVPVIQASLPELKAHWQSALKM